MLGGQRHKRDSVLISAVGPIELEGWLSKMGPGVVEGWKKRFFVLKEKRLFYFASDKELNGQPKGLIDLAKVSAVKESGDKTNRYFTVTTPERVYCLKAADERDMLRWVYGLNEALRRIAKGDAKSISPRPSAEVPRGAAMTNSTKLLSPDQPGSSGTKAGSSVPAGWRYSVSPAAEAAGAAKEAKLQRAEEELEALKKTVDQQKQEVAQLKAKLKEADERSERSLTDAPKPNAAGGGCCVVM